MQVAVARNRRRSKIINHRNNAFTERVDQVFLNEMLVDGMSSCRNPSDLAAARVATDPSLTGTKLRWLSCGHRCRPDRECLLACFQAILLEHGEMRLYLF